MIHPLLVGALLFSLCQDQDPKVAGLLKGRAKGKPLDATELNEVAKKIRPEIEQLRGETFQREVVLEVLDEAGFAARTRERVAARMTPEERSAEGTVAQLLGLIPVSMDWESTATAALERRSNGFYDLRTDHLYLRAGQSPGTSRVLLARGLGQALDDQVFDLVGLAAREVGNADERFALEALMEGSSMSVMRAWAMQSIGAVMPEDMQDATTQGLKELEDAPPFLWKREYATGLLGAAFLLRLEDFRKAGDKPLKGADASAAFRDPPRSSEQILHPQKYWDPSTRDDPVPVRFEIGELPAGWTVVSEDTLGEFGWGLVVQPKDARSGLNAKTLGRVKFTFKSSAGWGGDRILLLGRGEARVLHCQTLWDTPEDAAEFAAAIATLEESLRGAASGFAAEKGLAAGDAGVEIVRRDEKGLALVVWAGVGVEERTRIRAAIHPTVVLPPQEQR